MRSSYRASPTLKASPAIFGSEMFSTEDGTKSPEYALKADRSLRSPGVPGAHAWEP